MAYKLIKNEKSFFYTDEYIDYLSSYIGGNNCSNIIHNGECGLVIPCIETQYNIGSGVLSYVSLPYFEGSCFDKVKKILMNDFFKYIESFKKDIFLREDPLIKYDNIVIKTMLEYGFDVNVYYTTVIDLTQKKEILWQNLRKSYKSLINNIINNYEVKVYGLIKEDEEDNFYLNWIELYDEVTSRANKTQSKETWEKSKILFKNNKSFFVSVYFKNQLVAAVEIGYVKESAYYLKSAIKPEFESGISFTHALLWKAIEEAKIIGCKSFEIGPVFFSGLSTYKASKKELNISNFKLGMGGDLVPFHMFKYTSGENNEI